MKCDKRRHVTINRNHKDTVMVAYGKCLVWTGDREKKAVKNSERCKLRKKAVEDDKKEVESSLSSPRPLPPSPPPLLDRCRFTSEGQATPA